MSVTTRDLGTLAGRRFGVLYADPPWRFQAWSGKGKARSAENHYPTKTRAEIEALRDHVHRLAADDCALFLWAVMPQLPEALRVIEAWGFAFKTVAFTWVKLTRSGVGISMGLGYWTRANAELCLLATRGRPRRMSNDVRQIVIQPVGEHSRKPEAVRFGIERLVPGPYLELYGRRPFQGWTVWGNEVEEQRAPAERLEEAE